MRSLIIMLGLVFILISCTEEENFINQPEDQTLTLSKVGTMTSDVCGDDYCKLFTFDDVEDGDYEEYSGLAFIGNISIADYDPNIPGKEGYFPPCDKQTITILGCHMKRMSFFVKPDCSPAPAYIRVEYDDSKGGGTKDLYLDDESDWTKLEFYADGHVSKMNLLLNDYPIYINNLKIGNCTNVCFAPSVTLEASHTEIWPPNNKEVGVTFSGFLVNDCGNAEYELVDEYGEYTYSGTIEPGDYEVTLNLVASREGKDKDGRNYTFTVTTSNDNGSATESVNVVVPHDKGKKKS
ncbi:hypothetical protein ACFLS9_00830 [Bacteroidota bacterium]